MTLENYTDNQIEIKLQGKKWLTFDPYFEWNKIEKTLSSLPILKKLWIKKDIFKDKDVLHLWVIDPTLMYFIWENAKNLKWINYKNNKEILTLLPESKDVVIINHGISITEVPALTINTAYKLVKNWWKLIIVDNYDWNSENSIFTHLKSFWYDIDRVEDKIFMLINKKD